ncbi:phage antirepressor KilAC domain-containing protein [Subtercola vilae]|uniref:Phage antirepressor Ant n=1 Tax=Subtercola vilae TaxID=2056433 RepID=A0A4T2BNH0_9MICO|nr:phage antirepressor KilAC domain-containing protein [Subtercola vilae]TIH32690.1 phage antirepressor Ant [Subtercola vilae]
MTALDIFTYSGQQVRTVVIDGEPWFVAADILLQLDLSRSSLVSLDDDEKGVHTVDTLGGQQSVTVINEPGLYSLILRSRKDEAKTFKRWVTHDVLPAIRKTGRYGSDVDMLAALPSSKLLALAAEAAERAEVLQAKITADAPKVLFADAVATSEDSILVSRLAGILKQNGTDIGQNRLYERLRTEGYLCKSGSSYNRPTQRALDLGVFEVVERTVQGSDGTPRLTFTTKVTGKGQQYFNNRYATTAAVMS